MLQHSNSANELLLRRKLEEQQAAELQQAMELQSRRLMGLQLLDLKSRAAAAAATSSALPSPVTHSSSSSQHVSTSMVESPTLESGEQLKLSSALLAPEGKVNGSDKEESAGGASPNSADSDQSAEHNLPDSPFASPTKLAALKQGGFASAGSENAASRVGVDCGSNADGGGLRPISPLDVPSPRPYFPMHRLPSDHGALGM